MTPDEARARQEPADGGPGEALLFGACRLQPGARVLERDGLPVELGSRALDILIALAERPGEVVSHRELLARVWRGLVVDPGNLRVHINSLRRALGDGEGPERYIANVPGQGYSLVAPVRREATAPAPAPAPAPAAPAPRRAALPPILARMVGRETVASTAAADLLTERFVTIIGPGGMGKTTVAVSVAHSLLEEFAGAVSFIDLTTVTDPRLLSATVAASLGLTVQTEDVRPTLMQFLRSQRMLLVLDNCEHLIDAAASLAEHIIQETTSVHLLATSREAMRVEGEHAFWLQPLPGPPAGADIRADEALRFPAVRLFVERAAAGGVRLDLSDADASAISAICAGLDGMPLAIEFAAARVGAHGLAGTAELLRSRLSLQWHGRRTALPRHQTLQSLLDWSFELLPGAEQRVLRRLAIFVGTFTLDAAQAVAADVPGDAGVIAAVESLVAKSLVSTVSAKNATRFRLLEITRVYALERLEQVGERAEVAERHARFCSAQLLRVTGVDPGAAADHLGNIRAALEWAFHEAPGDRALAVELAVSAVKVFMQLSLHTECHRWSSAALTLLDEATRGSRQEMLLQEALATSSTWMLANQFGVAAAFGRALEIARTLDDTPNLLRLLTSQHLFLIRTAEVGASLRTAQEYERLSRRADSASEMVADFLVGISHHFLGNQAPALERMGRGFARAQSAGLQPTGLNARLRANLAYVRSLWISGFPERARAHAGVSIQAAEASGLALNICFIRMYTVPMLLWCGDLEGARAGIERAITHPNWPSLASIHDARVALQGTLWLREGDTARGVAALETAVSTMRANQQRLLLATAICPLVEGLITLGRFEEAEALVERAILEAGPDSEGSHFPEMLRLHAQVLLSRPAPDEARAERVLLRAVGEARRQAALSWELRAGMSLARLCLAQGRRAQAHELLSSIYCRFTEGFATADLRAAAQLVHAMEAQGSPSPS